MPISLLRLVGLVFALVLVLVAIGRLRRRGAGSRVPATGLLVIGLGLVRRRARSRTSSVRSRTSSVSSGEPLGRLVTVLVISVAIAYVLLFYALGRADRANQRVSRLVRALSAAQLEASRRRDVGRRARVHPRVRRGEEPAGGPRRDPDRGRRLADPRPGHRRRLARRHGGRRRGAWARTSSATRSTAARARRSRPATSSPSGSASRSSSRSTPTGSTIRARWSASSSRSSATRRTSSSARGGWANSRATATRARNAGITVYTRLINLLGGTRGHRHRQRLSGHPGVAPGGDRVHRGPVPQPGAAARRGSGRAPRRRRPGDDPPPDGRHTRRRERTCATASGSCG